MLSRYSFVIIENVERLGTNCICFLSGSVYTNTDEITPIILPSESNTNDPEEPGIEKEFTIALLGE